MDPIDKRAGRREVGACTRYARRMGVVPALHTQLYTAYQPKTTLTWLYFRVVKLDPKLPSRLRERLVTFEHSLSG